MNYLTPKSLFVYLLSALLLFSCLACSYKPSYLSKSRSTQVSERWKVEKIDSSRLSPDEASVYTQMGSPRYIRFFRHLSPDRHRIYEWIYSDPVRLVTFIDGKKVQYPALDENSSPWNEYQKKMLLWTGVTVGTVMALGLLYYYLFAKD